MALNTNNVIITFSVSISLYVAVIVELVDGIDSLVHIGIRSVTPCIIFFTSLVLTFVFFSCENAWWCQVEIHS